MSGSSENDDDLRPSLSSKKRKCRFNRSGLSSPSDESPNFKIYNSTPQSPRKMVNRNMNAVTENQLVKRDKSSQGFPQTPRSSERLRQKHAKSFILPSRKKTLEEVSPGINHLISQKKAKSLKPRKLVNNFLRERSSYVSRGDNDFSSEDSGMSDFINDDEEDEEEQEEEDKEVTEKELSDSSTENLRDSGFFMKKEKPKKRVLSSSDECADSYRDSSDLPSLKLISKRPTLSRVNGSSSDSESDKGSKKSTLKGRPTPLRSRSKRLQQLTGKQEEKNKKKFHALLKQRENAKLDPKERIAKKQGVQEDIDDSFSRDSRSSDTESVTDAFPNAGSCFFQSSEEDDDDRDFIVSDGETSDEGLNSDGASQFLTLLDTFTHKHEEEDVNYTKDVQQKGDDFVFTRRRRQIKRKEKSTSKWRRIKMEEDSENEESDTVTNNIISEKQVLIHSAVLKDDLDLAKKLLEEDPDCICYVGYKKRTALHLAALKGKEDFVKLLLKHGADCSALDCYDLPAIAYAMDGHLECVKVLLDHSIIKHISNNIRNNVQKMNLLHFAVGESRGGTGFCNRALCLELLFSKDKKMSTKMLEGRDTRGFTPLVAAVYSGQYECVKVLLKLGASTLSYKTTKGGNILHFAVESASHLRELWEADNDTSQALRMLLHSADTRFLIDQADESGFTPLMYACETGHPGCVAALLKNGASLRCVDNHGTSGLHLASISGNTQCVQLLLNYGHEVDCLDRYGWPPLLYANFKAHESCVLALMKPKPEQVFVLGDLLRGAKNEQQKRRTVRVVKNVLVSLAYHDAYYTVFNDFIRANPEVLDDNNYGLLQHTWRAILDFDNKKRWFTKKLAEVREQQTGMYLTVALEVDRDNVLGTVMEKIGKTLGHVLRKVSLNVIFKNEPGICTGPKREFFACLCRDIVSKEHGLFVETDDSQYSPLPNAFFAKYMESGSCSELQQQSGLQQQEQENSRVLQSVGLRSVEDQLQSEAKPVIQYGDTQQSLTLDNNSLRTVEVPEGKTWISCMDQKRCDRSVVYVSLRRKLKQIRFIGRMVGLAICENILLDLHLSKPFVKQVLGIALSHPDDLTSLDYELYKNAVKWVQENSVDELDLPFSVDTVNPWNSKPVTIKLSDETTKKLTDINKDEYVKLVSQFKLQTSIKEEIAEFSGGLHEVIPREILSLFTADEFSLLIGGVTMIDVQDWKKHTLYDSCSVDDDVIKWFWNVVSQLKEEEKALLVKFSTGSPCVPLGGFASLTGLGGPTRFRILKIGGIDKIPMASTCFNMLKLTSYSSEKQLREKLLIAIRHGAEGFSFA